MELEPITRKEKIIAGQDLTPITRMEMFLKNFGGGGGSVPKPLTYDYMPEGYPTKTVQSATLMAEQTVAFESLGSTDPHAATITNPPEITEGKTYIVSWDGTEYQCVCGVINVTIYIGNPAFLGASDTGEPFIYAYDKNTPLGVFETIETSASHTISVTTTEEIVTPMAAEFLPSEVDELIMNSSTTDSTKKFKITVDDSGAISATEVT